MFTSFTRAIQGLVIAASTLVVLAGCGSMMKPSQSVSIIEPANGTTVTSPFQVRFGVTGMALAAAGDVVANSGHHHLLINMDAMPAGESVPFTERHLHFGRGQANAEVTLPPGTYKLTAQFANGAHQSYGKAMSHTVTVTVK